jgi:hypothetical protein
MTLNKLIEHYRTSNNTKTQTFVVSSFKSTQIVRCFCPVLK